MIRSFEKRQNSIATFNCCVVVDLTITLDHKCIQFFSSLDFWVFTIKRSAIKKCNQVLSKTIMLRKSERQKQFIQIASTFARQL